MRVAPPRTPTTTAPPAGPAVIGKGILVGPVVLLGAAGLGLVLLLMALRED
jgi:hypothetical protein